MEDWKEQLNKIKEKFPENNEVKKDIITNESKWIDTHAHYDHGKFDKNRDLLINKIKENVEYIINLGTNVKGNQRTLQLIKKYDYVYGMVGFFPTDVLELENPDVTSEFMYQLNNKKVVGIGEIGLDYNWCCVNNGSEKIVGDEAKEIQKKWLCYQLDLAAKLDLPVSLHSRDAEEDTAILFSKYESIKGVMHCFSYGLESAKLYLDKGLYLGIGGTSTYKANNELREVIKETPLDRLLLETDAPYLSPEPVRRSLNDSSNITYVIDNVAKLKGISREEVIIQTNKNAKKLFNLK